MSRGFPSMTALLALLAMAGYQNRDKIAEWVKNAQNKPGSPAPGSGTSTAGNLPGSLGGALAGRSIGDLLSNGLRDLVDSFKQAGHGEAADSWVGHGPNKQIGPSDLEKALGPDVLATLLRVAARRPNDAKAARVAEYARAFDAAAAPNAATAQFALLREQFGRLFSKTDEDLLKVTDRLVQEAGLLEAHLRRFA